MSLKERYAKNSFFNVTGYVSVILLVFLTTPYIVHNLGYERYGILSLVLLVLGYFAFLDLGLGAAVVKFVAHYYTLKQYQKINAVLNSIFTLFMLIGVIGGVLIFLFARYFSSDLFKIPNHLKTETLYCFYIAAFGFFLNLIFTVIAKIPEAIQRFDIVNIISVSVGIFINVGSVVVLYLGYGLKGVIWINFMSLLIGIIASYFASKKIFPFFKIGLYFSSQELKETFRFGVYTVITRFSNVVNYSINQLVVGVVLGPAGVTIMTIPMKITSKLSIFINKICNAVFPMTSELYASNNFIQIKRIYLKLSRYIYVISSLFFVLLISYSKSLLFFWLGAEFADKAYIPMLLIFIGFFFITLTMIPAFVVIGIGKPEYNALFSIIGAIVNLIIVYPLTKYFGVVGSAISFLIANLESVLYIFIVNKKVLNVDNKKYFVDVFGKVTLLNMCFISLFSLLEVYFIEENIVRFLITMFFSGLVFSFILYKKCIDRDDKELIWLKITEFRKKMLIHVKSS